MSRSVTLILLALAASAAGADPQPAMSYFSAAVAAQEEEKRDPAEGRQVRRTPTMREAVYKKLAEAQAAAEAEDMASARELIQELSEMRNLSGYESAQMYNFKAYIAYTAGDYPGAIRAYENVLVQEDLPEALETGTLYSIAQLKFVEEDYRGAIDYLRRWMSAVGEPKADSYILLGQAYYQLEDYDGALEPVNRGIQMRRDAGEQPKEDWLLLLRVLYYEKEDFVKVAEILEELVDIYPKKTYWIQLAGTYGELEQPERRLITLELAYRQGLFDAEAEFLSLGQLLLQQDLPWRASRVIQEGIEKDIVEESVRNLRLLAQAYMLAQEDDKALAPLQGAARLSDDGDIDLNLGNIYLNREEYDDAVRHARAAIDKGIDDIGDAWLILGMALFNKNDFNEAERAFREARQSNSLRRQADQWLAYTQRERERRAQLAAAL